MSKTIALLSVALVCLLPGSTASIRAQETPAHPDFTGVYFPFNPNAAPAAPRGAGTPPRPVAVIDGRAGRPATAPKLAPEYLAKWEVMRQSRMAGSSETDPNANCLSRRHARDDVAWPTAWKFSRRRTRSPSTAS